MKARVGLLAGVLVLSLIPAAPPPLAGQAAGEVGAPIRVSTTRDLLRAIGPERTVILSPGEYDLSTARDVRSRYVSWRETGAGDDYELVLTGVDGLTVRGEGGARIVTPPPYSYVVITVDSRRVRLQDLGIGHREPGYCTGGVLRLEGCNLVTLEGLDLWGSGVVGLDVNGSEQVTMERSIIRECTSGAVWIDGSRDVIMNDVQIIGNDVYALILVTSSAGVSIQDSSITDNSGNFVLSMDEASVDVGMPGTLVAGNTVDQFMEDEYPRADLSGTVFRDNTFVEPTMEDEYGGEYYEDGYDEGDYSEEEY